MTVQAPTQMQRARELFLAIAQQADTLYEEIEKLQTVLGEAQNSPPEGGADGSIPEKVWSKLALIAAKGTDFSWYIDRLKEQLP